MGDYQLVSPGGQHVADLIYETEPPHGDSLHRLIIDGRRFPGRVWGRWFSFSSDGDWLGFSWAGEAFDAATVIADIPGRRFAMLKAYIPAFRIEGSQILDQQVGEERALFLDDKDFDRSW